MIKGREIVVVRPASMPHARWREPYVSWRIWLTSLYLSTTGVGDETTRVAENLGPA